MICVSVQDQGLSIHTTLPRMWRLLLCLSLSDYTMEERSTGLGLALDFLKVLAGGYRNDRRGNRDCGKV